MHNYLIKNYHKKACRTWNLDCLILSHIILVSFLCAEEDPLVAICSSHVLAIKVKLVGLDIISSNSVLQLQLKMRDPQQILIIIIYYLNNDITLII